VLTEHAGRIGEQAILGAPDLVIEVASPGTATYDRDDKRHAYERAGVPEYWIVDPAAKTVELFVLEGTSYVLVGAYQDESRVPSTILPGFDKPVRSFFG
jgi:Uma2 family endonuclease